ncbi:hypothetical protein [Fervidobacterium islandicum]|uniref:hypothetical protein n=1 Tax=Fervidobacterium islandicum TaxID=2423 RepID=UPI003A678C21
MKMVGNEGMNFGKLRTEDIKDIIVLSFGFFGLGFVVPTYIYLTLNFLLKSTISRTLTLALFYSELLFVALLKNKILFLFEMTRSAIGRRTPYILVFGTTSAFLLSTIPNLMTAETNLFSLFLVLLSFNFSLFVYSLSLIGLAQDKKTYFNQKLLNFQSVFWSIFGALWSYTYSLKVFKTDTCSEIVSHVSLLFFFSVFAVAFLIVEDKKYKIKLSTTEKAEIYDKFQIGKTPKAGVQNKGQRVNLSLDVVKTVLFYQIEFLLPLHAWYSFTTRKTAPELEAPKMLLLFVLGATLNALSSAFFKSYGEKVRLLGHVNTALALFIYATTFLLAIKGWMLTSAFLIGFFIYSRIQKPLGSICLGLERFLPEIYKDSAQKINEVRPWETFSVYASIILSGILMDIFGTAVASYVLGLLLVISLIVELSSTRAKIENKQQ